uniref:C2 domain-containing protein n=1 Tax=Romanomermis culicivorax TaxID=13658 RepID=A0A915I3P8_ROMCU
MAFCLRPDGKPLSRSSFVLCVWGSAIVRPAKLCQIVSASVGQQSNRAAIRHRLASADTGLQFRSKSSIEHSFCWPIVIGAGVIDPVDSYFVPTEKNLNFTVEIAGQDPVYKFPRTCDKSPVESLSVTIGEKKKNDDDDDDDFDQNRDDNDLTAVFSRGRCFNATVTLQTSKSLTSKKQPFASNMTSAEEINGRGYEKVNDFLANWAPVPAWIVFMLVALNLALVSFLVIVLWITKKVNSSTKNNKNSSSNRRDHHRHSALSSDMTTANQSSKNSFKSINPSLLKSIELAISWIYSGLKRVLVYWPNMSQACENSSMLT